MALQMRVLLLALSFSHVLAHQLEPDIDATISSSSLTPTPTTTTQQPPANALTNLLRDQMSAAKLQQTSRQSIVSQPTTVQQQPSSSSSSSLAPTTINSSSQQSQVTTTTTTTPTTSAVSAVTQQVPNTQDQTASSVRYLKALSLPKCMYNNQSYSLGQKWNDDCEKICECVPNDDPINPMAISACRDRCPNYKDLSGPNCTLQRSKVDQCCLEWVCESGGTENGVLGKSTNLPATTTTVINTERGQLNVSTTEIKLPPSSSQPTTSAWFMSTSSSAAAAAAASELPVTTTTMASVSPSASASSAALPISSQAPMITTTTTLAPPTTRQQVAITSAQQATQKVIMTTFRPVSVPTTITTTTSVPPTTTSGQELPKRSKSTAASNSQTMTPPASMSTGNNRSPKAAPADVIGGSRYDVMVTQPSVTTLGSRSPMLRSAITTTTTTTTTTEPPQISSNSSADADAVDPDKVDLCIMDEINAFKVGHSWNEEPCNQSCRCVFKSEPLDPTSDIQIVPSENLKKNSEDTEVRCGLPPQCSSVAMKLVPSVECPSPRLVMPKKNSPDKCACPMVDCSFSPRPSTNKPVNRISPPQSTTTSTTTTTTSSPETYSSSAVTEEESVPEVKGCVTKKNQLLDIGETFNDECHSICRCEEDTKIKCKALVCPGMPPVDSNCAKWTMENQYFVANSTENNCCPRYVCSEPVYQYRSCPLMGKEIAHGQSLPEEIQPRNQECEKACACDDGKIICKPVCPTLSDLPPEDLICQPNEKAMKDMTDCCPKWVCAPPQTMFVAPPVDYVLHNFDVVPLNATSVEVSLQLPSWALGLRGQVELNYTGLPAGNGVGSAIDMPPMDAHWIRKANIKTKDGIFPHSIIKYHLNNLKPAHKYWFKLAVHFHDKASPVFDDPLESSIQRVVMPPVLSAEQEQSITLPTTTTTSTSTSTTTTTTTTAPPATRILTVTQHRSSTTPSPPVTTSAPTVPKFSTTTTTTTTEQPPSISNNNTPDQVSPQTTNEPANTSHRISNGGDTLIFKAPVNSNNNYPISPCGGKSQEGDNSVDASSLPSVADGLYLQMNGLVERYAWYLLCGFSTMTILFTIVLFMYLKKSSRAIAPITSQSAYDNPSFTKLKSYNPQTLLIDETSHQNYSNKNLEVDKASPFHHHQLNDLHHHNGRQHLI